MTAIDIIGLVAALGIYIYCILVLCRFIGFNRTNDDEPPMEHRPDNWPGAD